MKKLIVSGAIAATLVITVISSGVEPSGQIAKMNGVEPSEQIAKMNGVEPSEQIAKVSGTDPLVQNS